MPDDTNEPNQHDHDDSFERRLRAIVSDAGADAPEPPDFRSTLMSHPSASDRRPDRRRRIAGFGAGALALAAALAAFFLVPRGDDDALVVSDSTAVELPTSSTDPATTVTAEETTPSTSEPPAVVPVTSDAPVVTSTPTTVAPITTTPPTTPTTTEPATTTTTTTFEPDTPTPPVTAIDLGRQEVFGYQLFATVDVDEVRRDIAAQLGDPTLDTDWQTFAGDCTGSTAYRVLWWGDLRMTFERYDRDGAIVDGFEAWSVGDPTVLSLAPIGDVPVVTDPSGAMTTTGLGVGSTRADVIAVADNTFADGDSMTLLLDAQASRFRFGADDRVTGFGGGAFDCPTPGNEDR